MKQLIRFLRRDIESLHHAAYILAGSTLLSQILALFRDRLLANALGASGELDVYYAAFRVQDFLFVAVASLLSFSVLIPFLVERIPQGMREVRRFISEVCSITFILLFCISGLALLFARDLSKLLFPAIAGGQYGEHLVVMMRILLLSPFLLSLSNLLGAVSQSLRTYYLYALSPVLYNAGIILGIVLFYLPTKNLTLLSWGVVLGAFLHLLVQVPTALREGFFPRPTLSFNWSLLRTLFSLSIFRSLALLMGNITLLFLVGIASSLGAGALSILTLANNLQSIPLALIGATYSVAAFPVLSRVFQSGEREEFAKQLSTAARHIIFWSLPATVLFIVLRAQIVRVILGSGNFTWEDTRLTAAALALFVVSVTAQSLSLLCLRGYYATKNTARPLLISFLSAIATVLAAYAGLAFFHREEGFRFFIESLLRVTDVSQASILMLPLSFTFGALLNMLLYFLFFKRDFGVSLRNVLDTALQSFSAAIVAGFAAYHALQIGAKYFAVNTFFGIFFQGLAAAITGLLVWGFLLHLLKSREYKEIIRSFRYRLNREHIVGPQEM